MHLWLLFVNGVRRGLILFFCMWISSFPSTIYWRDCLFPIEYSWLSCQTLGDCICMGLFLGSQFCSGPCVWFCFVLLQVPYCFDYYSFATSVMLPDFFLLSPDFFGYLWSFVVPYNFRIFKNIFVKNAIGILIGIAIYLSITLGSMAT